MLATQSAVQLASAVAAAAHAARPAPGTWLKAPPSPAACLPPARAPVRRAGCGAQRTWCAQRSARCCSTCSASSTARSCCATKRRNGRASCRCVPVYISILYRYVICGSEDGWAGCGQAPCGSVVAWSPAAASLCTGRVRPQGAHQCMHASAGGTCSKHALNEGRRCASLAALPHALWPSAPSHPPPVTPAAFGAHTSSPLTP